MEQVQRKDTMDENQFRILIKELTLVRQALEKISQELNVNVRPVQ